MVNRTQGHTSGPSTKTVVRPTTMADLTKTLSEWITETRHLKHAEPDLMVLSQSGEVLVVDVKLTNPSKTGIELQEDLFELWFGKRRLAVHLDDFYLKTALHKSRARLELTPR